MITHQKINASISEISVYKKQADKIMAQPCILYGRVDKQPFNAACYMPVKNSGIYFGRNNVYKTDQYSHITENTDFTVKDIKAIKGIIDKCEYGKKDLISDPDKYGFKVEAIIPMNSNGDYPYNFATLLNCHNFYTPDDNPDKIYGICEELAYKAGERLKKNGDYIVKLVGGRTNNQSFDYGHVGLLVLKKTPENEDKIENLIANLNELNSEKANIEGTGLKEYRFNTTYYKKQKKEAKNTREKIKTTWDDLEKMGGLFVDPSFGVIEKFKKDIHTKNYGYSHNLISSKLYDDMFFKLPRELSLFSLPILILGKIKNIAPELNNFQNKENLLNIVIGKNRENVEEPASVQLMVKTKNGEKIFDTDHAMENRLKEDNPLKSFITRIREQLKTEKYEV